MKVQNNNNIVVIPDQQLNLQPSTEMDENEMKSNKNDQKEIKKNLFLSLVFI